MSFADGSYSGTREGGSRYAGSWEFAPQRGSTRGETLRRLDWLATLLDAAFLVRGTNIRFGLDGIIGLVPGIGDAITTAVSLWIIHEAYKLGIPRHLLLRMVANVALDGMVGAVPIIGDAFDVMWRANRRNVRLLREWMEREGMV